MFKYIFKYHAERSWKVRRANEAGAFEVVASSRQRLESLVKKNGRDFPDLSGEKVHGLWRIV